MIVKENEMNTNDLRRANGGVIFEEWWGPQPQIGAPRNVFYRVVSDDYEPPNEPFQLPNGKWIKLCGTKVKKTIATVRDYSKAVDIAERKGVSTRLISPGDKDYI